MATMIKDKEKEAEKSAKPGKTAKQEKRKQSLAKVKRFFTDVRSEFKKITWPDHIVSRKKTIMVIVTIIVSSIVIYGFDKLMLFLVSLVVSKA